eukprot:IDg15598t1
MQHCTQGPGSRLIQELHTALTKKHPPILTTPVNYSVRKLLAHVRTDARCLTRVFELTGDGL